MYRIIISPWLNKIVYHSYTISSPRWTRKYSKVLNFGRLPAYTPSPLRKRVSIEGRKQHRQDILYTVEGSRGKHHMVTCSTGRPIAMTLIVRIGVKSRLIFVVLLPLGVFVESGSFELPLPSFELPFLSIDDFGGFGEFYKPGIPHYLPSSQLSQRTQRWTYSTFERRRTKCRRYMLSLSHLMHIYYDHRLLANPERE